MIACASSSCGRCCSTDNCPYLSSPGVSAHDSVYTTGTRRLLINHASNYRLLILTTNAPEWLNTRKFYPARKVVRSVVPPWSPPQQTVTSNQFVTRAPRPSVYVCVPNGTGFGTARSLWFHATYDLGAVSGIRRPCTNRVYT